MTISAFLSLQMLLLAGCVTPGPNNAFLAASGMNFGYRRSLPHMMGVLFGHAFMEFMVALGLGVVYEQFPLFRVALQITAIGLLLWLAYKIASAPVDRLTKDENVIKPWTFWQAFVFQWINPKAWLIAIGVSAQFASGTQPFLSASLIFLATALAGVVSTNLWTGFGLAMARILNTPLKRRLFNFALAALIILSVFMLIGDDFATL